MTSTERHADDRSGYPPPALTAAVLGLIAVILAAWAIAVVGETSARAFASYTPVEATVVDEHTETRLVADRRGSSPEAIRVVTVELPDGSRADVPSDDLDIGAGVTVLRSDAGAVYETEPARPGPLEWALCAGIVAAAVVLGALAVRSARRLRP